MTGTAIVGSALSDMETSGASLEASIAHSTVDAL